MDYREVAKHNSSESCWVILYDRVYDVRGYANRRLLVRCDLQLTCGEKVTEFLPNHPGGAKVILQLAGKDATDEYDPVHPPGTLEDSLSPSANLGKIDLSTKPVEEGSPSRLTPSSDSPGKVDLKTLLNIDEIEEAATKRIPQKAWAYYYSAADDLHSKTLNNTAYRSILFRPRIFIDCTSCLTDTTMVSYPIQLPIFVAPAAMARLVHPDGEHAMAQACAKFGVCQVISNNASMTPEQIVDGAAADQVFGWQMYVQTQRSKSEEMLRRLHKLPQIKFIVLTLDAPVPGKREHDERMKNVSNIEIRSAVQFEPTDKEGTPAKESGGIGASLFAGTASDLKWATTLPWLAQHTELPIVLKGLQTHEDAYLASLHAPQVRGIILSNHGGRAMDTAPPAIHTLCEIRKYCPDVLKRLEVFVDGGIKRGTDVVKALCLGAKAVGIGRAPLWGLGAGGPEGVARVFEILKAEIETCMRLLGVERIDQLGPQHVNARALERDIYDGPAGLHELGQWFKQAKEVASTKSKL